MAKITATDFFDNRRKQILDCFNPIQKSEPVVEIQKSEEVDLEKGGVGSGRKQITIKSPFASHSFINGKTYDVHKETTHHFASGPKKYYHIKDEDGDEHEIPEDAIKKSEELELGFQFETEEPTAEEMAKADQELEIKKSFDDLFTPIDLDISKGGAGSRGGKVIGHTKSGKPIYEDKNASHTHYKDFSLQDHKDAYKLHDDLKGKYKDDHDKPVSTFDDAEEKKVKKEKEESFKKYLHHKKIKDSHVYKM
jgi:hypothetical protein